MAEKRYRADYYLFRHFTMGMGSFRDGKVISHHAMKLVFGINQPFRIRIENSWFTARAALIDGGCPHYLNGKNDWQIVLWIDPQTALHMLLRERALKDRPWALHELSMPPALDEVIQTVSDTPDPEGALRIAEMLIRVYAGASPFPTTWDDSVKKALEIIDEDPGGTDTVLLSGKLDRDSASLEADFRRVLGCSPEDYLHRRKWMKYIESRQNGVERNKALALSGLPGWEGLKNRFDEMYGLDLNMLENALPFVRVYHGHEDEPVLFL